MSDYTTRGIAKREAAKRQMLQETASNFLRQGELDKESAEKNLLETAEKQIQMSTSRTKSKRHKILAVKEFDKAVTECTKLALTEMVYRGIPAEEAEKQPYKSNIVKELSEFFESSVCNYDVATPFIKSVSEEISVIISEGFDNSGIDNTDFTEYAKVVITEELEDKASELSSIVDTYAKLTESRTLAAILTAQNQAEELSNALEERVNTLSENTADDKTLSEIALKKVYNKVKPTLFESVFTFIKRRIPEGTNVSNELVMQEAACFTAMLEGANLVGVLPKVNMNELTNRLCQEPSETLDEDILDKGYQFVEKLYKGYSPDEVKEIAQLFKSIKTSEDAKKLTKQIDKAIKGIEKDEKSGDFMIYMKGGIIGKRLRVRYADDRQGALKHLKKLRKDIEKVNFEKKK